MNNKHRIIFLVLASLVIVLSVAHLFMGHLSISAADVLNSVFQFDESLREHVIVRELRIPRMLTALLVGAALSLSGLLMQTLFQNPLAGPYVLGINSGASLFVALAMMTGIPWFSISYGIYVNALLGSFAFGLLILFLAKYTKNQITLLLTGIMLGSFTSAFIAILQQMSDAQELKRYTLWNLGSLQHVQLQDLPLLIFSVMLGIGLSLLLIRSLNAMVIGSTEAMRLGIRTKKVRYTIIAITALLTGVATAFCGPIAFVGLAVPNIVRIIFRTQQHRILILATVLTGSAFLLAADVFIQAVEPFVHIPINAITSLIGAPLVVAILFRKIK
jgi:iron complex transport system permease protein